MKNIRLVTFLMVVAIMLLPITLSGCDGQEQPAPSSSSTAEPTETPTSEPSQPESEPAASSEPEPTDAPDNAANFEEAFAENPIDAQLADALDAASSSSTILKAYETAGKYWKAMIPIAYDAAKTAVSEENRAQLEQDQQTWEDTINGIVAEIQEKNSEGGEGKITAARLIQERYRETARSLCEIIFSETGELPDFASAMSSEPKG